MKSVAPDGPTALVLSGGGARAAYQVGALRAIAELFPELEIPILTGVSAGAINTVYLAAHPGPFGAAVQDLEEAWAQLGPSRVYQVRPLHLGRAMVRWLADMVFRRQKGPPAVRGLMDLDPLRRFLLQGVAFGGIQRNVDAGRLRAVALSATCYNTGQTVTFLEGDAAIPTWRRHMRIALRQRISADHLLASAAIPIVFPAVRLGDAYYGDGSVRQTAPLAPAIHLGARRIIAIAMRGGTAGGDGGPPDVDIPATRDYPVAAEVFGMLLHSVFLDTLDADAERMQVINRLLASCERRERPSDLREVGLLLLRPSRDLGALARGQAAELPRLVQLLVSSVGGERARSPDFLSYLMFQPGFTRVLMELGYDDTLKRRGEIEGFLGR